MPRLASTEPRQIDGSGLPAGARLVKACNRCRERKIRCDGRIPTCRPCEKFGVDSCDVVEGVLVPYARVAELEERVEWLTGLVERAFEGEVRRTATRTPLSMKISTTQRVITQPSLVEEIGLLSMRAAGSYIGSMAGVTMGNLVASALRLYQSDVLVDVINDLPTHPSSIVASIPPSPIAGRHVYTYLDRIHRWYPLLNLKELDSGITSAFSTGQQIDTQMRFTLMMIFALGDPTNQDPYSSSQYYNTALSYLPSILANHDTSTVRATLLICIYGLRRFKTQGPQAVDVWQLVGFALRLSISMGLTRSSYKWDFSEDQKEDRRRLWWCVYAIERIVATGTGRVLGIRNEAIDAHLPKTATGLIPTKLQQFASAPFFQLDLHPAIHLLSQRQLLGDIMECVYIARPRSRASMSLEETSNRVFQLQTTLIDWQEHALSITIQETVERAVLQLAFHSAALLLYRPSPSFPVPPSDVLDICLAAARGIISVCATTVSNNTIEQVMPGWAGFNDVFMAGVTLMYCSWANSSCTSAIKPLPLGADQTDIDIVSSIQVLATLTTKHLLSPRYLEFYQQLVSSLTRLIALESNDAGARPEQFNPTSYTAAEDTGLFNLDGLELDQEAVDLISRMLFADGDSLSL